MQANPNTPSLHLNQIIQYMNSSFFRGITLVNYFDGILVTVLSLIDQDYQN